MAKTIVDQLKDSAALEFEVLKAQLRQERDELKLQTHLMANEAKEEWREIEKTFRRFSRQASEVTHDTKKESAEALHKTADGLRKAFARIRNALS